MVGNCGAWSRKRFTRKSSPAARITWRFHESGLRVGCTQWLVAVPGRAGGKLSPGKRGMLPRRHAIGAL